MFCLVLSLRFLTIADGCSDIQTVYSYTWATAGDNIGSDPIGWLVYGSTDCSFYSAIHYVPDYPTPTTRMTFLPAFLLQSGK